MPKFNLYQSLHTTVVGPEGKPLEVQIRTWEMHTRAEYGVAAHWEYKEKQSFRRDGVALADRRVAAGDVRSDAVHGQPQGRPATRRSVRLHARRGKIVTLPVGATPVDFAYAIHTEIGHKCIGARVNGRLVPLETRLQSGDTIEIFTSKVQNAGPSQDWLKFVVTHRAANRIKQWHNRERREDRIEAGRDDLIKALRREALPVQRLLGSDTFNEVLASMGMTDAEALYERDRRRPRVAQDGRGACAADVARRRRARRTTAPHGVRAPPSPPGRAPHPACTSKVSTMSWCGCRAAARRCRPTRSSASSHAVVACRCTAAIAPTPFVCRARQGERLIDVEWDEDSPAFFVASIEVKALDRRWLLRDVAAVVSDHHVNVLSSNTTVGSDRVAKMRFEFELSDVSHLDSLLRAIKDVDSVYDTYRVLPGAGS